MKKLIKIITLIIISVLTIAWLSTINNANANIINKFKNNAFHFEKFQTAAQAKEALLKIHPLGSNIRELMSTLESAGATCNLAYDFYSCGYSKGGMSLSSIWITNIYAKEDNFNLIDKFYVTKGFK